MLAMGDRRGGDGNAARAGGGDTRRKACVQTKKVVGHEGMEVEEKGKNTALRGQMALHPGRRSSVSTTRWRVAARSVARAS